MYEFVQKLAKKKKKKVGISTRDQHGLQSSQRHAIHHPTSSISAHFIYIPYNKKTIRKSGLYDLTRFAYSQPLIGILAGLAQLSQDTSISGIFLEAREDPPKKYFWRWQQDHKSGCGEKLRETKNN